MARTSRKNIVAPVKSPPTPKTEYSAALYARIKLYPAEWTLIV